ncbi:Hypothetical protein PENO1_059050 [Penicillium occitanis (nom. inval.)]|nr:Hypothetical protein PENO1_059050 [Penicillium occitanis (nom. inval.)]PCG98290.1 hypothetical protein PENOC_064020 [Penicillium occitanis (nom. inval.)]
MRFSLLATLVLIAYATAYNLTLYTDDSCSEGATDFSGWNNAEEFCVASEAGQNNADVTLYTGQTAYDECQSSVTGAWSGPDGIGEFLGGVVD